MSSKVGFWRRQLAPAFEPACIVQLIQVELLRRRQSLVQNRGASLPNFQLLNSFVYIGCRCPIQTMHGDSMGFKWRKPFITIDKAN